MLFQQDLNINGKKKFIIKEPTEIFEKIINQNDSNFYEYWTDDMLLSFSLDIDIKDKMNEIESINIIKEIIKNVIDGANTIYKYHIKYENIYVLQSNIYNEESKKSYHIIFKGLVFKNYTYCRDFYNYLKNNYNMEYSDDSIYGMKCFRICFSSKLGVNNVLVPIKININNNSTNFPNFKYEKGDNNIYEYWLNSLISYNNIYDKIIDNYIQISKNKKNKSEDIVIENNNNNTDIDDEKKYYNYNIDIIKDIIFSLPKKYYDEYEYWISMGFILHNLSLKNKDQKRYYELWKNWSKQSDKFDSKYIEYQWNNMEKNINYNKQKKSFGTVIKWCNDEKIDINTTKHLKSIIDKYPIIPIELNYNNKYFNKKSNVDIIKQAKLEPELFNNYLNKKLLGVQSEKGTGKTSNLFKSMFKNDDFKDKKILFISSKRTFGAKLFGDLEQYGFKLYSEIKENNIFEKKIICQIDSLLRVQNTHFDYIIVDECESLARYFSSSHFTKSDKASSIISRYEYYIRSSDHIFILDADLSNRCINYYMNLIIQKNKNNDINKNIQLIINEYTPCQDYTIYYNSYNVWLNKLYSEISLNKKIVIPMASNNKAKDLYSKIKIDYPHLDILMINRETPDEEKVIGLLNINEKWIMYDIIIYTPSVCMGVSFDVVDYFDYIFAYGCENSLGSKEFCQMLHRIRNPKNKVIYLSLDKYKLYKEKDHKIEYDQIEKMLCKDYYLTHYDLHNNLVYKKVENNEDNELMYVYPYKEDSIYELYINNSKEILEDKINFSAYLFGYMKFKKYNIQYYEYNEKLINMKDMSDIRKNRLKEEQIHITNSIFNADIINENQYNELKNKTILTDNERFNSAKYHLGKIYSIDNELLSKKFIEEYYNKDKMKWYQNLSYIIKSDEQDSKCKLDLIKKLSIVKNIDCYTTFSKTNKYVYHYYTLSIIDKLKFDINNLSIKNNSTDFNNYVKDTIEYIDNNKKDIAYKFDINLYNKNIKILEFKQQLKYINNIIKFQYGLKIKKNNDYYILFDNNIWNDIPRNNNIPKIISTNIQQYNNHELDINSN